MPTLFLLLLLFFFNDTATTEIYTLSLHDALPISKHFKVEDRETLCKIVGDYPFATIISQDDGDSPFVNHRSEEHTSELQSLTNLVCRLLLEKKKKKIIKNKSTTIII